MNITEYSDITPVMAVGSVMNITNVNHDCTIKSTVHFYFSNYECEFARI